MTTRAVIEQYYELANAGKWDAWCDLFTENCKMDEQLAGHIEGRETLRGMMQGFTPNAYVKFQNVPKHIVVEGNQAAVVSHISAIAAQYPDDPIEAEVVNYYQLVDGKIDYMANFHDSKPFTPFLRQIGALDE
ncbi:MAG: nuclear transport factor 2 family protein [Phycisphaerae bacterium]|nr:nuclear transport factor 2 family protein [Phycisphaerae bacterium]